MHAQRQQRQLAGFVGPQIEVEVAAQPGRTAHRGVAVNAVDHPRRQRKGAFEGPQPQRRRFGVAVLRVAHRGAGVGHQHARLRRHLRVNDAVGGHVHHPHQQIEVARQIRRELLQGQAAGTTVLGGVLGQLPAHRVAARLHPPLVAFHGLAVIAHVVGAAVAPVPLEALLRHALVVAHQQGGAALVVEFEQLVHGGEAARTPVDGVAQRQKMRLGKLPQRRQQQIEPPVQVGHHHHLGHGCSPEKSSLNSSRVCLLFSRSAAAPPASATNCTPCSETLTRYA